MHLVGVIVRIYHDAWSPEHQNTTIHNNKEQQGMSCRHVASQSGAVRSLLFRDDPLQITSQQTHIQKLQEDNSPLSSS